MGFVDDDNDDIPFVHQRHDTDSKLMVTFLISISIVVFLVTILHMYIRSLVRRHSALGRATLSTTRNSRISNVTRVSQVEPPKNGLHPSIISSLPIFLYKKSDPHDTIECSICLRNIEDGELVRILPNCKHNFHVECIDKWFDCNSTCPICRAEVEPRLLPEPREGVVSRMPPSAPPTHGGNLSIVVNLEETSSSGNGASSRLSSFKRIILSRERSSQRLQAQSCSRDEMILRVTDLEFRI